MTQAGRIRKLEASLPAKEKFFLWLNRAKAAGGFLPYWEKELKGPLVPFEWFEDEEVYFLFRLVNDLNFTILNNATKNQDLRSLAHCAADGIVRQISRPDQFGALVPDCPIPEIATRAGMYLCAKFRTLLEEAELTEAAIEVLSKTYLGGEDILFPDSRAILDAETSSLRVTAEIYELLAKWLDLEPIAIEAFTLGHPMVDAKVNQIVHVSRAEALVCSSDRRKFIDALQRSDLFQALAVAHDQGWHRTRCIP